MTGDTEPGPRSGGIGARPWVFVLVSAAVVLLATGTAAGATAVSGCTTISSPGGYELTGDITNSSAPSCINITTSDVVFDGLNNTIEGDGSNNSGNAIDINGSSVVSNVTARNVNVVNWSGTGLLFTPGNGVGLEGVKDSTVEDVTVDSAGSGVVIASRGDNENITVSSVVASVGQNPVAVLSGTGHSVLDGEFSSASTSAVFMNNSTEVEIRNNKIDGSFGRAVKAAGDGTVIVNNTVMNAGNAGVEVVGGSVVVRDNTVDQSGDEGVRVLDGSNGTRVLRNNVFDSNGPGIKVNSSTLATDPKPVENVSIVGNDISGSNGSGAVVDSSNDVTLENNDVTDVGNRGVFINDSSEVTVRGGTVDMNDTGGNGVESDFSDNVTVEDVNVTRTVSFDGINMFKTDDSVVRRNDVSDIGGSGIRIDGANVSAIGNEVTSAGQVGIESTSDADIVGNVVDGTVEDGIDSAGRSPENVSNNVVNDTGEQGLEVLTFNAVVINNTVSNTSLNGTFVENDGVRMADNVIEDTGTNGIFAGTLTGLNVTNATVRRAGANGVNLTDVSQVDINDSRIVASTDDGIDAPNVGPSDNVTIARNRVIDSAPSGAGGVSGIELKTVSDATVVSNNVSNNSLNGIRTRGPGGSVVIDNNTLLGNFDNGILSGASDNTIVNNTIRNSLTGVSASDDVLTNNTITGNDFDGIGVTGSADNVVINGSATNISANGRDGVRVDTTGTSISVADGTVRDNTDWDLNVLSDTEVDVTGVSVGASTSADTRVSGVADNAALTSVGTAPADPANATGIGRYLNATNTSASGSFLNLTFGYDDADVSGVNESSLSVWRNNSSTWTELGAGPGTDAGANEVQYNISQSEFSSVFAPLANETSSPCRTINSSGSYRLTSDVINSSLGSCINITASDVVFDGQGHTIDGNGTGGVGINVTNASTTLTNVTVRNVTVTDWRNGIKYREADRGEITGVNATGNSFNGIFLGFSSDNNSVTSNNATGNSFDGIFLDGADGNSITGNKAFGNNDDGIELDSSNGNDVTANNLTENYRGVYLFSFSNDNNVTDNEVARNSFGVNLQDSNGNSVANNDVTESDEGVSLFESDRNRVSANNVTGNDIGIEIESLSTSTSRDNEILDNDVTASRDTGILLIPGSDGTVIDNNTVADNNQGGSTGEAGIKVDRSADVELTNNDVHRNTFFGVVSNNSDGLLVRNNEITNNCGGQAGLAFVGSSNDDVLVESNNVSNNTGFGIDFGLSAPADGSNFTVRGLKANRNGEAGVVISTVPNATLRDIQANGNEGGVFVASPNATLDNVTANRSVVSGIFVGGSAAGTVVKNSEARSNADTGVVMNVADVTVRNTTATGNGDALDTRDTNTTLEGFDVGSGVLSGTAQNVTLNATVSPPADPQNATNVSRYFNATNTTSASPSQAYFDASLAYNDTAVQDANVTESALGLRRYNGTAWVEVPGSSVDTTDNLVSANITTFSRFGAFAGEVCTALDPVGGAVNPPTDTDSDGLCEDVNGDGSYDLGDVSALYNGYESDDTINNNPSFFDFNDDSSISLGDVINLYNGL